MISSPKYIRDVSIGMSERNLLSDICEMSSSLPNLNILLAILTDVQFHQVSKPVTLVTILVSTLYSLPGPPTRFATQVYHASRQRDLGFNYASVSSQFLAVCAVCLTHRILLFLICKKI